MGQVPGNASPRPIGVVGDGRMARHFLHYLRLLGYPPGAIRMWSRAQQRAIRITPEHALQGCGPIFILIKDDAIDPFLRQHPALTDHDCVHFSGSVSTPLAEGFHPLCTFGPELYAEAEYRTIPFITSTDPARLREWIPALPNPVHRIAECDRPLYHALCAMAGNFTTLLWRKLFSEFSERLGLPREAAYPYLARITANLMDHPEAALTGPLARGDFGTIEQHLRALQGDAFQDVYRAFTEAYSAKPEVGSP